MKNSLQTSFGLLLSIALLFLFCQCQNDSTSKSKNGKAETIPSTTTDSGKVSPVESKIDPNKIPTIDPNKIPTIDPNKLPKIDPNMVVKPPSIAVSKIYVCHDKIYKGNPLPAKNSKSYSKVIINEDGTISEIGVSQQGLAGITDKMWSPGDVINVGFYRQGVSNYVIDKIKKYAGEWEKYANIKFNFPPRLVFAPLCSIPRRRACVL